MKTRKPRNPEERDALRLWQAAHPAQAMQRLADAGYDRESRVRFLVLIAGVPRYVATDHADLPEPEIWEGQD